MVARKSIVKGRDIRLGKLFTILWRTLLTVDTKTLKAYKSSYQKTLIGDSVKRFSEFEEKLSNNNAEIIVYGSKKALRIDINDIPILKRNSRGCISMSSKTTQVEGMSVISKSFKDIVVVTKNGYINKIIPDCIQKGRSKAGSNVIKLGKTDNIVAIYGINPTDTLDIILAPTGEIIEIPVNTIPTGTSISNGTKMIKGGDIIRVIKKG